MELSSFILYLSDRHATHTRVQYTCPCIGAHLAGKREAFPPSNTVGLHRLPVRGNTLKHSARSDNMHLLCCCTLWSQRLIIDSK